MTFARFSSHGVLFRCPFQHKFRYCPFDKFRKLAIEERIEYLNKMSLQQLNNLENHYNKCVAESKNLKKEKSLNK